jgi:hypothetical protein
MRSAGLIVALTLLLGVTAVAQLARADLIDAWNDDRQCAGAIVPAGAVYSYQWAYTPAEDCVLERVEFYTSGVAPPAIAIASLDGTQVSFALSLGTAWTGDESWQGATFAEPPELSAGEDYYLILELGEVAVIPFAVDGTAIPFWRSETAGQTWEYFPDGLPWMVRFHGTTQMAAEAVTWSGVKTTYR